MGIDHRRQHRVDSPVSMPMRITPPPPPTCPQPARKRRRWGLLLLVPLGLLLAAAAVLGTLYLLPGSIGNAGTGDCVSYDRSNSHSPYATVPCGSSAAGFKSIFRRTDSSTGVPHPLLIISAPSACRRTHPAPLLGNAQLSLLTALERRREQASSLFCHAR